jgi:DNA topoisomerase-1
MAVESFIPLSDVKQTIEKEVKRKPKTEELTTIEKPGKPSPASMLEDTQEEKPQKATKSRTKKTSNTLDNTTEVTKKDSILIITEKPQAAMKIASSLGNEKKLTDNGVSYYQVERNNEKIIVASAVGHLYNLNYVKGQKGWPIFDLEWIPSYDRKSAAFTKKYFMLLKKLSKRAKEFIVATDFDNEGEVIGWNVLRFICNQKTAKRMKYSTLTKDELIQSYEKPLSELSWGNAYAGETRHFVDWLYGINLSRALMSAIKKSGVFRILSIGRVQGPALKIIVDREREIEKFKSQPYWQISALYKNLEFMHPENIFDKKLLEKFKGIKEANAETKNSEETIPPGVPFDLTTLQREAYRVHKLNPSETLKIAQKLYLEGYISYPRTSSQKIPDSIEPKKILKKLEKQFPEAKGITRTKPFEGKKSDPAHPSIYPTGEFAEVTGNEEKLYNLIAKRFIACFYNDAITSNKRITLTAIDKKGNPLTYELEKTKVKETNEEGEYDEESEEEIEKGKTRKVTIKFSTSGLTIKDKGWTKVYPRALEEVKLPDIEGKVKIDEIKTQEKETQPPNRYTAASLVSLLEKRNLGTKATRSSIVDTLFQRGYLDGTSIKATDLGGKMIETLEKYSPIIIDEELTRQLETEMEKIQEESNPEKLEKDEQKVIDKAKKIITDISKEFKSKEDDIAKELGTGLKEFRQAQQEANTLQLCPTCKKGNLRIMYNRTSRRYFVSCSAYPNCRQTYSLPPNALIKKTDNKVCEADGFPKLLAIRKSKRPWEFCFNPNCEIEKKKREDWEAKNTNKAKYEEDD